MKSQQYLLCLWRARSRPGCGRGANCSQPRPSGGRPPHLPPANLVPTSWTGTLASYSCTVVGRPMFIQFDRITTEKKLKTFLIRLPILVEKSFFRVCLGQTEFYIWISVFFYPIWYLYTEKNCEENNRKRKSKFFKCFLNFVTISRSGSSSCLHQFRNSRLVRQNLLD